MSKVINGLSSHLFVEIYYNAWLWFIAKTILACLQSLLELDKLTKYIEFATNAIKFKFLINLN